MTSEDAKLYFETTKVISEFIVAVAGACAIIWLVARKVGGVITRLTPKKKNKGARGRAGVSTARIGIPLRISVTLALIFPYIMAFIYYAYDDYWTAALWFIAQGLIFISIVSSPINKFEMFILWITASLVPLCLYFDVLFSDLYELRFQRQEAITRAAVSQEAVDRSKSDLFIIRSVEETMGIELKNASDKSIHPK